MITISICMIVKNEEDVLARCLSSIQEIADEIIIIDTGSQDRTKEIAYQYTNKVYDFAWCDDFSKARNFSFSKASSDYLMWIDADDILLEEDRKQLLHLKDTISNDTSLVMMKYNTSFNADGSLAFTHYRERLLRRSDNFQWEGFIHEVISPRGKIIYSDIAITHKKEKVNNAKRNLEIYTKKLQEGVHFTPRDIFYYARELYYHKKYDLAILEFQHFLDTRHGWVENNISACQFLGYCHSLLNDKQKAISSLFNSFVYDLPRAEICCDLGKYFYELKSYEQSIYWYKVATTCTRNDNSGAFVIPDCYDYIPYIQMCVCYDALQDYEKANLYNELAGKCKPLDTSYLHNKAYFQQLLISSNFENL